ncbi:outer membrane adhesin-like protein, partial [Candidatus Magnetomorum sp. HK-1]
GAGGASEMYISNDSYQAGGSWEKLSQKREWQLTANNGDKPVYVRFRDKAGNLSQVMARTVYTQALPQYTIQLTAGDYGEISPSGTLYMEKGENLNVTILPDSNYRIYRLTVDGKAMSSNTTEYVFQDINADHRLAVTFEKALFKIVTGSGDNGSIGPNGEVMVEKGQSQAFNITPETGYAVEQFLLDMTPIEWTGNPFMLTNITEGHQIFVTFTRSHTLNAQAEENGQIIPSGTFEIAEGNHQPFEIKPDKGYAIDEVLLDNEPVEINQNALTLYNIQQAHDIKITFKKVFYTIQSMSGVNGIIQPEGNISLQKDSQQAFQILADDGYILDQLHIDGISITSEDISNYTFTDITSDHTIAATFKPKKFIIQANAGSHGSVQPSGDIAVNWGDQTIFIVEPASGYSVDQVILDGQPVNLTAGYYYTLKNILANHTFNVSFKKVYQITAISGTNGQISPSGMILVEKNNDQFFELIPDHGFELARLQIDDTNIVVENLTYTFSNVISDHQLIASYQAIPIQITATSGINGVISPSGLITYNMGSPATFLLKADPGYEVAALTIDGVSMPYTTNRYIFESVDTPHKIDVSFQVFNYAPTVSDATFSLNEDTSVCGNLKANDEDGDLLTYEIVSSPEYGQTEITNSTDGLFCYTPNKDAFGTDQFTFQVNDSGKSSNIGTVTVNIKAQNDMPVALDDHWIVIEDSLFTTQLKANDVDNEPLTYTLLENNEPGLAVLIDASTGEIKYQPGLNQNGEDSLKFLVSDGTFVSEIAEVTILIQAINDPPVAHPETLETGRGQSIMLTLTASDIENDALQYNITALPKHGTLTVVNMPVVEYLPNKDFIGTDSFEFSAQDDTDTSNTAVISIVIGSINTITQEEVPVTLNVKAGASIIENPINGRIEWIDDQLVYTPSIDYSGYDTLKYQNPDDTVIREIVIKIEAVNDAPVIEPMPSVYVLEDQMKAITIIATDPDADPLTYSSTQTQHGTIIGTGPVYHYYPDSNYHGTDLFMVTVSDKVVSRNIQIHITVLAQNDPPVLSQIQTIDVLEDSFVELTINATDHDHDSLILQIIDNPEHGILQGISLDMMNLTYTPEANFEGWDYFTCKAFDGTIGSEPIQISIKVLGINDPPIANGYHVNGYENTNIFGQLSGSDIENQKLLYELITQAVNGLVSITPTTGEFLYRPSKDFIGNDHFAFSVSDGYTRSVPVTVTIIVSKGNRPPVGESGLLSLQEDSPAFYTLTATDSNQDTLTFQIVDQGTLGQVQLLDASTGRCKYIPHLNKNGTDMFTFIANDSMLDSNITTITVQISPINDPPVGSISTLTTDEDFEKLGTLHASDVEGDSLIFSIENQGSKGNVTLVNAQTGTYRYNPYANLNGTDSFQFTVSDGQDVSLPVTVDVIIQPQNDKPIASSLTFQTIEDTAISNMLKASDIDGDALTFIKVDEPDALSKGILEITDSQSGAFTYYPPSNKFGSFVIEYYVTDGKARSENVSLTIQVLPANDAPIVFNQNLYTESDTELLITLSGYDIDQDPLIFETSTSPRHGQLIKEGENYRYTPETGFQGIDVFTYQSNDQSGTESALSNIGIVSIRVGVPLADIYTQEDNPVSIDLLAGTDFSAEDVTDYQMIAQPSHGLIMGTGQARSFLPNSDYYGLDSFTYIFTVASKQYTGEISIYIIPVNDPPRIKGIIPYPALTYEDQPLTLTLSISDQDTPLSSLNISLLQSPSHGQLSISGQKLYYKPSQNYSGTDQVIVSVTDGFAGSSSSQVIDIQVAPSNDAPIAFEQELETLEETQINILPQAVDQESDPLVYEIVQGPLNGQLLGQSPSFTYVPNQNFFGTDSFTFVANDGVLKSKETLISINVKNKNDPPKANSGSFKSSNGNSIEGRLSAFDMDGDILIYSLIQQPQKGLFVLINPVIGTFVYYPHTEASGIDSFSYKVFDGTSDSNTALVNITIESDATQNQFTDLRIKLLPPYKNLDDYTYMFIEADTGQMVLTGSHVIDTVDVILLKGNYRLVIIAPNYLPYEYENESNQKYFELIENQQELNVELVQKQSFNPKPPGVDVSYMVTPYGIKLWAVKKNIIEGDQFYMHIQTASGEIPVDSQEITGDGTANAPYTYQWTQSSPWTNFTGQTYEVEFIFYGGVYGHAEKIDQISISWQRNQLNRQRSVSDNDTNAFTHEFGNSPLYISQGNSEFYPLVGTVCHATLMDNQGIERHMSINIPPIPLEYLYIDNADISGGQLNYNSETDQFQLSQELTIVQPDDKLYISINYYTFGTANAGNGVSLSFYMVEGPFAGKAVRYNPILGDNSSRMENAPLIALPIYLNPNSELLSDISDLSKVELEILVNERGDGEHGFRSETLSTTIEDDGLVFVEINHLTLVGLDVIIESPAPTPSGSGDSGGSGCFIDNISNTLQYSRWHEIIGFVFICV